MIILNSNVNFPAVIPAVNELSHRSGFTFPTETMTVAWMNKPKEPGPFIIGETGFFYNACHFDSSGLFSKSSLRGVDFIDRVNSFTAPYSFRDKIMSGNYQKSKFPQPQEAPQWNGVVLATQNPRDKSITEVGPSELWWMFYRNACAYYNRNLFVKIHPWVSGDELTRMQSIADQFGCKHGKVAAKVITSSKFVLVYNSTFAVDCFLHGVRVACFADGYFSGCGAVTYTQGRLPDDVSDNRDYAYKLYEWLAWKYCVWSKADVSFWDRFFVWCKNNYPHKEIPTDMAYANYLDRV